MQSLLCLSQQRDQNNEVMSLAFREMTNTKLEMVRSFIHHERRYAMSKGFHGMEIDGLAIQVVGPRNIPMRLIKTILSTRSRAEVCASVIADIALACDSDFRKTFLRWSPGHRIPVSSLFSSSILRNGGLRSNNKSPIAVALLGSLDSGRYETEEGAGALEASGTQLRRNRVPEMLIKGEITIDLGVHGSDGVGKSAVYDSGLRLSSSLFRNVVKAVDLLVKKERERGSYFGVQTTSAIRYMQGRIIYEMSLSSTSGGRNESVSIIGTFISDNLREVKGLSNMIESLLKSSRLKEHVNEKHSVELNSGRVETCGSAYVKRWSVVMEENDKEASSVEHTDMCLQDPAGIRMSVSLTTVGVARYIELFDMILRSDFGVRLLSKAFNLELSLQYIIKVLYEVSLDLTTVVKGIMRNIDKCEGFVDAVEKPEHISLHSERGIEGQSKYAMDTFFQFEFSHSYEDVADLDLEEDVFSVFKELGRNTKPITQIAEQVLFEKCGKFELDYIQLEDSSVDSLWVSKMYGIKPSIGISNSSKSNCKIIDTIDNIYLLVPTQNKLLVIYKQSIEEAAVMGYSCQKFKSTTRDIHLHAIAEVASAMVPGRAGEGVSFSDYAAKRNVEDAKYGIIYRFGRVREKLQDLVRRDRVSWEKKSYLEEYMRVLSDARMTDAEGSAWCIRELIGLWEEAGVLATPRQGMDCYFSCTTTNGDLRKWGGSIVVGKGVPICGIKTYRIVGKRDGRDYVSLGVKSNYGLHRICITEITAGETYYHFDESVRSDRVYLRQGTICYEGSLAAGSRIQGSSGDIRHNCKKPYRREEAEESDNRQRGSVENASVLRPAGPSRKQHCIADEESEPSDDEVQISKSRERAEKASQEKIRCVEEYKSCLGNMDRLESKIRDIDFGIIGGKYGWRQYTGLYKLRSGIAGKVRLEFDLSMELMQSCRRAYAEFAESQECLNKEIEKHIEDMKRQEDAEAEETGNMHCSNSDSEEECPGKPEVELEANKIWVATVTHLRVSEARIRARSKGDMHSYPDHYIKGI